MDDHEVAADVGVTLGILGNVAAHSLMSCTASIVPVRWPISRRAALSAVSRPSYMDYGSAWLVMVSLLVGVVRVSRTLRPRRDGPGVEGLQRS
jgi:hypothetical protein